MTKLLGLFLGLTVLALAGIVIAQNVELNDLSKRHQALLADYLAGEVLVELAHELESGDVLIRINQARVYSFDNVCSPQMAL